jgi:hypothetical protein
MAENYVVKAFRAACIGGGIASIAIVFNPRTALLHMLRDKTVLKNKESESTKVAEELMRWVAVLCFYITGSLYWISSRPFNETKGLRTILGVTLLLDSIFVKYFGFCTANTFTTLHGLGHVCFDGCSGILLTIHGLVC